ASTDTSASCALSRPGARPIFGVDHAAQVVALLKGGAPAALGAAVPGQLAPRLRQLQQVADRGQQPAVVPGLAQVVGGAGHLGKPDRKSTRLNSSHVKISYAVF